MRRPGRRVAGGWAGALVAVVLAAGGCGDDGGGSLEAFCPMVADRDGLAAVVDGFDPSDRERALDQLRVARIQLGELRVAAPREIHADLDVQIDAAQTLIDALDSVPRGDPAAAVAAVRAVQDDLGDVTDAGQRLEAWTAESCPSAA